VDGAPLPRDVATPIDPGMRVITASAPGKKPFRREVKIEERMQLVLDVPALENAPRAESTVTREEGGGKRTAGYFVGGLGIIGLGVGSAFGLRAISKWSDSNDRCPNEVCTVEGANLASDAQDAAKISNIAFAIGGVATVVGIYLIATGGPRKVTVTARGPGLYLGGSW
jgi:hypothetical protein